VAVQISGIGSRCGITKCDTWPDWWWRSDGVILVLRSVT
jgi:hypothetical protein